ncbi:MAG: plasmid pRiA4b ORF-3 family protein [Thermovirgaceae bacterium]|nr:plasmid pRiA4b ORF-3 family protein [Thermovirgaceae bacterium]
MNNKNIQLYIELDGITPKIWRRFVVPSIITLDRLHDVIQIVMGWTDSHMHEFMIKGNRYTDLLESEETEKCQEEGLFRLESLIDKHGADFTYTYDFGDEWVHKLKIEKTNLADDEEWGNLFCIEGWGSCPPEDVGGIPGFEEFCEAISDKKHPEHETLTAWYGEDFLRDFFSNDEANLGLLFFLRWSKDRILPWQE